MNQVKPSPSARGCFPSLFPPCTCPSRPAVLPFCPSWAQAGPQSGYIHSVQGSFLQSGCSLASPWLQCLMSPMGWSLVTRSGPSAVFSTVHLPLLERSPSLLTGTLLSGATAKTPLSASPSPLKSKILQHWILRHYVSLLLVGCPSSIP